jgi:5-methylcytosine-specific restriction protein A
MTYGPHAWRYNAEWRRLRDQFLASNPACIGCGDEACEVDHIKSVRLFPELRLTWTNLRPYCHRCHSRRTAFDQSRWGDRAG